MNDPLILSALRTPFGARHGALAGLHPVDLLGDVLEGVLRLSGVEPADVDEVLVGCATPVGAQADNLAGHAARARGPLRGIPATTVSTLDTSSLVALVRAVDAVRSGRCDVVLVGGVEVMSAVPAGADMTHRGFGLPAPSPGGDVPLPPGPAAERWAARHGVDRQRLEDVAQRSRTRAARAQSAGRFAAEFLPVCRPDAPQHDLLTVDELLRREMSAPAHDVVTVDESHGPHGLAPEPDPEGMYSGDGPLTASTVAPMADGAAAAVVASPEAARRLGAEPVAGVVGAAIAAGDPGAGRSASLEAASRVLAAAGVSGGDVRRVELAELFATSVVEWQLARPDVADVVNLDGGSLALGHPRGATGLGLLARLVRASAASGRPGHGLVACDAVDGHGVAVLLQS